MVTRPIVRSGRAQAERLMDDECVLRRPGGPAVLNPTTGVLGPPAPTVLYDGPCRVRMPSDQNEATTVTGERLVTEVRFAVWLPVSAPRARIGDLIEVYESDDRTLPARHLRVVSVPSRTHLHYRELGAVAVE